MIVRALDRGVPEEKLARALNVDVKVIRQRRHLLAGISADVAELLKDIGNRHGKTAAEVAIAWTLRHPAVTGAIVGARNAGQVDGFVGALDFRLSETEINEIDTILPESIGLIEMS